jgi:5-methyltetrahydropteroyltriglutamate--homocysteine methyltransferase
MADDFGYHIDHHGSLVRPADLAALGVQAAVAAAAHAQRRLGLSAVGDGQFRRACFESVVHDHVPGFLPVAGPTPLAEAALIDAGRVRSAPDAPAADGRLAADEAAAVLAVVDRPVFVALPSPGYLAALGSDLADAAAVDAVVARGAALAAVLRGEVEALARQGVAYVALGNPLYVPLVTVAGRARLGAAIGVDVDSVLRAIIEADRAVAAGLDVPADFRLGLDLTDGGPLPFTGRGYDPGALDALLDETPFPRVCVDFPADPAARLPVERIKPGLVVSLGVVDVSDPALETVDALLDRLDPVLERRGEADVAIATNGGFAQSADRPAMTPAEQDAKLRLVEMLARYYWGNEI